MNDSALPRYTRGMENAKPITKVIDRWPDHVIQSLGPAPAGQRWFEITTIDDWQKGRARFMAADDNIVGSFEAMKELLNMKDKPSLWSRLWNRLVTP